MDSPKQAKEVDIPFSKNRYSNEINRSELKQSNHKKALEFLKQQEHRKSKQKNERRRLLERKREYQEQVRKLNKERLHKTKRNRNNSAENTHNNTKRLKPTASLRSKSEEIKGKSKRISRKLARERIGLANFSDAKIEKALMKQHYNINTISAEEDGIMNTLSDPEDIVRDQKPPIPFQNVTNKNNKLAINVDLTSKLREKARDHPGMSEIDISGQKNSIEDDDENNCLKTPELDLNGEQNEYSQRHSDNKLSVRSTEKQSQHKRETNR